MKKILSLVGLCLMFAAPAFCWNCTDSLAERVPVPTGTTGTYGDGNGQLFLGVAGQGTPGQLYECEVVTPTPPTTPTTPTTSNSMSNSTSSANSAANSSSNATSTSSSNQTQNQKQNQSQTANGGNASATGGNATIGNVSSTSTISKSGNSSIQNSGNSSNKNTNTATGGNQTQTSTSSANGNGVGNGDNSNNYSSTTNVPRDVATAFAPTVLPTTPCFKGFSGGGQGTMFGFSFGGGKIDANCADLEASRLAPSLISRCKVYLMNKYVKAAGVTMTDCLAVPQPAAPIVIPAPPAPQLQPVINITVPPATVIIPAPAIAPALSVAVAAARIKKKPFHVTCNPKPPPLCKVVDNDNIKQQ
jgi:hypothetical protein